MTDKEIIQLIALTKAPQVGPIMAKNLIAYCGSVGAVFEIHPKEMVSIPSIGPSFIRDFNPSAYLDKAEEEFLFAEKNGITIIPFLDKSYPARLHHVESAPIVLFYKGNQDLNHTRTVAIVGTRTPTEYGKMMCEKIVEGLKPYNVLLISGLAFGIDVTAHRKCVEWGIPTLGILGHGLDRIYPQEHKSLSSKMINNGGVLTEFTSGTNPDRENFPMRNRIIAAMSDGVIVVESKRKGGSIITAEYANDYNKDVFALPGPVTEEKSEGCNKLIKQNKAHLLESAADMAYIMRWDDMDSGRAIQKQLFVELNEKETILVNILKTEKEAPIDRITYKAHLTPSETASILLELEFKGLVRSLPGKRFILT